LTNLTGFFIINIISFERQAGVSGEGSKKDDLRNREKFSKIEWRKHEKRKV